MKTSVIILASVIGNAILFGTLKKSWESSSYEEGFNKSSSEFKQLLLEEGYAEYDKKTAEWKLLDPSTIQGNLIPAPKRINYVTLDDQIVSLKQELMILEKQKILIMKRQPHTVKLDFKKI
jgi:hypothetical protein